MRCDTAIAHLALLTTALSAPTQPEKRSFKVLVPRSAASLDGPTELAKAYKKHGWSLPSKAVSRVATSNITFSQKAATGSAPSTEGTGTENIPVKVGEADTQFLSPVTIGGQEFNLNFDTGSSDLWVFSNKLPKSQIGLHSAFDPSKSKTFQDLPGATFQITYGDKSHASGTVGYDEVKLGSVVVPKQAVELASVVSSSFAADHDSDGLLGLASSKISAVKPQKQLNFFENILPTLAAPVFTANLRHHTAGAYQFGHIDTDQFKGELHYSDVDETAGFWQFQSSLFAIGEDTNTKFTNPTASPAIADTGTTLLIMDDAVVQRYYANVEGAVNVEVRGGWHFPCSSQLPDLHVQLAPDFMGRIPGELINFSKTGENRKGPQCFGGLQSNNGGNIQIFGDVLLKSMFTVFEQQSRKVGGKRRVGFAPHA